MNNITTTFATEILGEHEFIIIEHRRGRITFPDGSYAEGERGRGLGARINLKIKKHGIIDEKIEEIKNCYHVKFAQEEK